MKYNTNDAHDSKFKSDKELKHYLELRKRKLCGEVKYFLRDVPFDLGRSGTYFCDFLVVLADDSVSFEDTKQPITPHIAGKKALAESKYGIRIKRV